MSTSPEIRLGKRARLQLADLCHDLDQPQERVLRTAIDCLWKEISDKRGRTVRVNDLILADGSTDSGSACRDSAIPRYLGQGQGRVIKVVACSSCPAHGRHHPFARLGEIWEFNPQELISLEGWDDQARWELVGGVQGQGNTVPDLRAVHRFGDPGAAVVGSIPELDPLPRVTAVTDVRTAGAIQGQGGGGGPHRVGNYLALPGAAAAVGGQGHDLGRVEDGRRPGEINLVQRRAGRPGGRGGG